MKIQVLPVGMYQTNCYLVSSQEHLMIIDPGDGGGAVLKYLEKEGLIPEKAVVTHGHMDHFADAGSIARRFDIPLEFPEGEVQYLRSEEARRGPYDESKFNDFTRELEIRGHYLREGDVLRLGQNHFEILILPGHSDAGMCLYEPDEKVLFAGDQLFAGSVGRMDLYHGDGGDLIRAIRQKLLILPEDTVVLPGHGTQTTIGAEKKYNPFLSEDAIWDL